jgi:hypothetical protein
MEQPTTNAHVKAGLHTGNLGLTGTLIFPAPSMDAHGPLKSARMSRSLMAGAIGNGGLHLFARSTITRQMPMKCFLNQEWI